MIAPNTIRDIEKNRLMARTATTNSRASFGKYEYRVPNGWHEQMPGTKTYCDCAANSQQDFIKHNFCPIVASSGNK